VQVKQHNKAYKCAHFVQLKPTTSGNLPLLITLLIYSSQTPCARRRIWFQTAPACCRDSSRQGQMNLDCSAQSAVTLSDVVQAAPRLLEVLPPESLKALSATCSFLHTWTRTQIKALTLPSSEHLTLMQCQQWPSLCVVWITATADTFGSACLQHVRRDWAVPSDMVSSSTLEPLTDGKRLILIMPATKHLGSHGLAPCQLHLPAMSQFAKRSKEAKSKFVLIALLDKEEDTLRQLSSITWPHLLVLAIFNDCIGSDAFLHLKPDNLPSLVSLTIKTYNFDTQAAVHLAKGLPRRLSSLLLFTNIDAAAAHHLSTANWPHLVILHIKSNVPELPGVQTLDAASVQKLAQGQWPLLKELNLSCNDLDQCAIVHLIQGRWPMLRKLTLDSKCMTEAVCDMLCIVNVSEQLQAMQCEITKPSFGGRFQLKRLSSTIWPLLQDVCVVCK